MGSGHAHHHGTANERALLQALALTAGFMLAEVVAAILTGSLALLSDAAHMFTDATALGVALGAARIARRPADRRRTYGYHRFEVLAAAFNATLLVLAAVYILYEAWQRLRDPPEVQTLGMFLVALGGLVVNWVALRILAGGSESNLNMKGAYLEVWSDLLGSVAVIAGAAVIWLTGWLWVDALLGVGIALWVLPRSFALLRHSTNLLLEGVPEGVDLDAIERAMRATPGVLDVHDLHVWALSSSRVALTSHVAVPPSLAREQRLEATLGAMLAARFGITHSTIQVELPGAHDTQDAGEPCGFARPPVPPPHDDGHHGDTHHDDGHHRDGHHGDAHRDSARGGDATREGAPCRSGPSER